MRKKITSASVPACFLIILLLASCEKDKPLNEQIIGKWEVQSIQQVNYENDVKLSETTFFLRADEYSIQFAEEGSGILYEDGEMNGVFTWVLTGNIVRITIGNSIFDWTITLNNNTLVWSFTDSEVDNGTTYKYEYFYSAGRVS